MPSVRNPESFTKEQLKTELRRRGVELPKPHSLKADYIDAYNREVLGIKSRISGFSSEEEEPAARITRSKKKMAAAQVNEKSTSGVVIEKILGVVDGQEERGDAPVIEGRRRSPRKTRKPVRYIEESEEESFPSEQEPDNAKTQPSRTPGKKRTPEVRVAVERVNLSTKKTMTSGGIVVSELSDQRLRSELENRGITVGPLIASTRKVYEKRLEDFLQNAASGDAKSMYKYKTEEYSDQDSAGEEDEEEEEEEVIVDEPSTPVRTRSRTSILRSSSEKDSSATRRRAMRSPKQEIVTEQRQEVKTKGDVSKPLPRQPITPQKSERHWIPVWVAILIVVAIVGFFYLVIQTMEANPPKLIPEK